MKTKYAVLFGIVAVAATGVWAAPLLQEKLNEYRLVLPDEPRPSEAFPPLDQNWTEQQRQQFHFTAQGTRLLPVAWFRALEQPCFSPFGCGLFSDSAFLNRFGFIPSHPTAANPDGFPIGFAIDQDFVDPYDKRTEPVVGLTCAACHTGELYYDKYVVQVEGAPAMIEVAAFQKALALALSFTTTFPLHIGRYRRFEERVLGPNATPDQKRDLKTRVEQLVASARATLEVTSAGHIYDNPAGFMRTDALTRIGNQVFAADMNNTANYVPANSPVRYPQIWDASWFNWVQYNSSIADPLARNIGEALGVRAIAKLSGPDALKFENSVNMRGLHTIEQLLAGDRPFGGLASPKWPSAFPPLDQQKVAAGEVLYRTHCQQCHLPPRSELETDLRAATTSGDNKSKYWWQSASGNWYLRVTDIKIDRIGTDPRQATDFANRRADGRALGLGPSLAASDALDVVTKGIANRFFEREKISPEEQIGWAGGRDPRDPRLRAELIYKARPLNGIWAVAPYLHNGSVLTLDALLSPDDDARPARFWMGSKRFDPIKVGYAGTEMKGATLFDTTRPGNANTGHRFKDGPRGNGVIGPALSPRARAELIEFLKSQ